MLFRFFPKCPCQRSSGWRGASYPPPLLLRFLLDWLGPGLRTALCCGVPRPAGRRGLRALGLVGGGACSPERWAQAAADVHPRQLPAGSAFAGPGGRGGAWPLPGSEEPKPKPLRPGKNRSGRDGTVHLCPSKKSSGRVRKDQSGPAIRRRRWKMKTAGGRARVPRIASSSRFLDKFEIVLEKGTPTKQKPSAQDSRRPQGASYPRSRSPRCL